MREPAHTAEPLDSAQESPSLESSPPEQAIDREEEAILWRSLERIPEIYREHQSVERVAEALALTEDAVHQRLSRGRKLLQDQVLGFVEGALERTKPGKTFTLGVIAALPLVVTTANAVTAGIAIKGGSTVKAATSTAMLGAVLTASVLFLVSSLGFLAFTGGCIGCEMGRACAGSARQLENATRFWRAVTVAYGAFFVVPSLYAFYFHSTGVTQWLGWFSAFVPAALAIWIWRWWRELRERNAESETPITASTKRLVVWLTLGMIVPVCLLGTFLYVTLFPSTSTSFAGGGSERPGGAERWLEFLSFFIGSIGAVLSLKRPWRQDSHRRESEIRRDKRNAMRAFKAFAVSVAPVMLTVGFLLGLVTRWHARTVSTVEAQKMVVEFGGLKESQFEVFQFNNGSKELWISRQRHPDFIAPADGPTLSLLKEKGLSYKTYIQGRDFGYDTPKWPVTLLVVSILVVGAAAILWWVSPKAIAVLLALVSLALGILLSLGTPWQTQLLSTTAARKMITERQTARIEIFEYSKGSRELWITPLASKHHPRFIAPADESTIALLAANEVAFNTLVQGRDFGHAVPRRGVALLCIFILAVVTAGLLWLALRKRKALPAPADANT